MYIEHPLIKSNTIERREYQVNIAATCIEKSTLVVLPTGMGKTVIALLVIAEMLKRYPDKKILFLAPTKPLVEQHASFLREHLVDGKVEVFTGEVSPSKRERLWSESTIVVSTPQVIANDIIARRISLEDVNLIIFDEAHRAVGDYAYVFVAEKHRNQGIHIGMTASPGSDVEKILEVCQNIGIERVEIRSKYDPDVIKYMHDIYVKWVRVDLPKTYAQLIQHLKNALNGYIEELKGFGVLLGKKKPSTKDLLAAGGEIRAKLQAHRTPSLYRAATVQAAAVKVNHAVELAETQGLHALKEYFERMRKEATARGASKASKLVMANEEFRAAMKLAESIDERHPKIQKVVETVAGQLRFKRDSRIIVFTHYRDTSDLVVRALKSVPEARPVRFVGQASRGEDKGLRQKEQVELIQAFKNGTYNVLVATSVAEEGLDIPSTDLVIFYEPIPSEIRTIQRRGRTGRKMPGRVVILITKRTRDEGYYWSSRKKEREMHAELETLRQVLKEREMCADIPEAKDFFAVPMQTDGKKTQKKAEKKTAKRAEGQKTLADFDAGPSITIIADTREFNSPVVRRLSRQGIGVKSQQLDVGDYVISERVGVERKEVEDFLTSLMDGRLFQQAKMLRSAYTAPLLIVEGEGIFSKRGISKEAIMGAFSSLLIDFRIPLIMTKNAEETAELLISLAKRERSEGRIAGIRGAKGTMPLHEQQQFVVEGLPNISGLMAQRLLSHFGTIQNIANADAEELCKVRGIGKKTAEEILKVLRTQYIGRGTDE